MPYFKPLIAWLTFHQKHFHVFCSLQMGLIYINGAVYVCCNIPMPTQSFRKPEMEKVVPHCSCLTPWLSQFHLYLSNFLSFYGRKCSGFFLSRPSSGSFFGNEGWHRNEFVLKSKQTFFCKFKRKRHEDEMIFFQQTFEKV